MKETDVRALLGCFLFRGDDVFKKVRVLSGGEKSRLALVKLLLDPPNFLLMDEPTTHLDMSSIDALVGALKKYSGTLIFISHDVYFIRALATKVLHVNAGRLTPYAGGYQYFLEKTKSDSARVALTASLNNGRPAEVAPPRPAAQVAPPAPVRSQKEQREVAADVRRRIGDQRKHVAQLELTVAALESRQADLAAELEKPETYTTSGRAMVVNADVKAVAAQLVAKTIEWETAASTLAELEAAAA